ncbi:VOC family protein [Pseudonocardia lutea]|uniref:VOC family protein n=1 Tax=Pseudonocardia lutea TaxID=2172015 RepID=A0ABW1IGU6_9PSEU
MTDVQASVRYLVEDVHSAARFYTEHLDFHEALDARPTLVVLERDALRLVLNGPGSTARQPTSSGVPTPGGWNRIQLVVDDLDGVVSRMRAGGVAFRTAVLQGRGGSQVLVDDPSGNPVEIFQPDPATGS